MSWGYNVNELSERLGILIVLYNTSDTDHGDEIMSIIKKLHKAGIINENEIFLLLRIIPFIRFSDNRT